MHGNRVGLLGGNGIDLVVQGTESGVELLGLHVVADLSAQLSDDVTLRFDLVLQLTFLQGTELVDDHGTLVLDSAEDGVRLLAHRELVGCLVLGKLKSHVGVVCGYLRAEGVGLLTRGQTVLAAALGKLFAKVGVTCLDGVDYLKAAHADLRTDLAEFKTHDVNVVTHAVYVAVGNGGQLTQSVCSAIQGLQDEIPASVVVELVGNKARTTIGTVETVTVHTAAEHVDERKDKRIHEHHPQGIVESVTEATVVAEKQCSGRIDTVVTRVGEHNDFAVVHSFLHLILLVNSFVDLSRLNLMQNYGGFHGLPNCAGQQTKKATTQCDSLEKVCQNYNYSFTTSSSL